MFAKTRLMNIMFAMMNLPTCEKLEQIANDFLDGILDAKKAKVIKRHLHFCKSCQKFLESYQRIISKIELPHPTSNNEDLKKRMLSSLQNIANP